ncbi:MAG TPA: hypothetical protein PKU95_02630 [Candidatus Dojkabacteria bacterium]|nr:hypothetical protein [Candidatus Dojkabacteria bacterium]
MRKKILNFVINFSIFYIFLDLLPGLSFPSEQAGKFYTSLGFVFVVNLIPFLLGFFKFPKLPALVLAAGVATIFGYFYILNTYFTNFVQFYPTVIGNADLIFFTIPPLLYLNDINSIFLFSSVLLMICSIILNKQIK